MLITHEDGYFHTCDRTLQNFLWLHRIQETDHLKNIHRLTEWRFEVTDYLAHVIKEYDSIYEVNHFSN